MEDTNDVDTAPVDAVVMPICDACPMCGVPFNEHMGVIGTCRKYHGTRAALMDLIRASECALKCITNEFGYLVAKANFEGLMDAIDIAKRAATLEQ